MAARFLWSKMLLFTAALVVLTFAEFARGNAVERSCLNGSCADEVANTRASGAASEVTNSVHKALTSCELLTKGGFDPLDPAKLDSFIYSNVSQTGNWIRANFSSMNLTGISTLKIKTLMVDTSKLKLQFTLNFTAWNVTGRYNLTTTGARPVRGNDTFVIAASEARLSGNSSLKSRASGALYVDDLRLVLEYGKTKVLFHKLDKGASSTEASDRLLIGLARRVLRQTSPKLLRRLRTALESCLNSRLAFVDIKG